MQRVAALALTLCLGAGGAAAEAPARVVSMNLCTDQLAMLVAAPGQLVSVSFLAADPASSAMAEEAAAYPVNHGLAEEIFLLDPDLVIAGSFTTRATVEMLRRLGIPVAEFAPASSIDDVRARVAEMGRALGRGEAAHGLLARFDADLAALEVQQGPRPRAATYYANSYTAGRGTLAGAIMEAAGLANIAAEIGLAGGGWLPLERLVLADPDVLVTGEPREGTALAEEVLTHPALRTLRHRAGETQMAGRDWVCGTPHIVAAIRRLAAARDAALGR